MRLVITGGGTGGHVYPALEVATYAQEESDLLYLGSLRGMEASACETRGIKFKGFASEPVYKVTSISGIKALARLFQASMAAKKELKIWKPDIVFSTGGYSSAPIMRAAKSLGIPLAIHACDTIPGRSLRMFSDYAGIVTSTFNETTRVIGPKANRTGHPIRTELRQAVLNQRHQSLSKASKKILIVGGSGGAKFLNDNIPAVAKLLPEVEFLLSAGKAQYNTYMHYGNEIPNLTVVPYLEQPAMIEALQSSDLAIARSGSGISEFAMARIPSLLIPLPTSADDHQLHNAIEFMNFGGCSILIQPESEVQHSGKYEVATPQSIAATLRSWLSDPNRQETAIKNLADWDNPNATAQIWTSIKSIANHAHQPGGVQ